ncbi:Arc family DNA-binding protein [Comamonas sp. wu1-DMT]|uniref:Arc family DNA-binding protein n=1 Tax=Comamonas sp. wu1-DMT TaxID=3126390 RepID=UPI0032E4EE51
MASEDVQTNLRLPADLKDRLVASAAENNRSLSAEVASRLASTYEGGQRMVSEEVLKSVFAELGESQRAMRIAQVSMRDLLASYVRLMYARLPKNDQEEVTFKLAYELASDLKEDGNPKIESILGRLIGAQHEALLKTAASVIRGDSDLRKSIPGSDLDEDMKPS